MSERVDGQPGEERPDSGENREELLRKYDTESAFRTNLGYWKWVVFALGTALTTFQLYTALRGGYVFQIQGAIHVGAAMGLVYLLYPAKKEWSGRPGVPFYDVVLAAATIWTNSYIVINYERLTNQSVIFGFSVLDYTVAALGILLILEATRRCVGLPIVVIASCALVYGWLGPYMPIFPHAGFSLDRLATDTFFTTSSIFGTPIQVSATFIFLFLFFGVILVKTNIGQFFNDLAFGLTGGYAGGTAKAAVVASGLQGTISGSSVANTVTSGSFTIPMMKRAGFRPHFAAAAEASASTGGQIMPPIMGAAAFIMAEYTGVPYNEIIVIAIVPAILYFTGVFTGTHFVAKRDGIVGVPRNQLPAIGGLLKKMDLMLPLVVIIGMLLSGFSAQNSALYGIASALLISFIRSETRMSLPELGRLFENGARAALPVIGACATAGIIAGTVTRTGLGGKLAGGILDLALGNFFLLMFFTMIACLVLGMGLPTTANYVVTATVAAPILLQFDVPLIAAHFFVFYFGIVADITPPVCLAAYAGAGIAGANPMRTGVTAVSLAIAAFIIPYIFVTEPVLVLEGATVANFVPAFGTAVLGMIAISGAVMGYFMGRANSIERLALLAGGVMLVYPLLPISLAGLGLVIAIGVIQYLRGASGGKPPEESEERASEKAEESPA
ncbi:MAG: TRAP transporter permease [Actinomycetota bacterium]|jgi:TRAP transporter 4TM/12TM fusion protein|nr:TRAP transporter permease [Actinomycetota bacterium]